MDNNNTISNQMTEAMARKILISIRDEKRCYPQDLRFNPTGEEIAEAIEFILGIEP